MRELIASICFLVCTFSLFAEGFVNYKMPKELVPAPEFKLEVNGQEVFVYNSRTAAIAYFSFEGKVDVKVTFTSTFASKEKYAIAAVREL